VSDRTRCFFHLVKGRIVLTDDIGDDAANPETAVAQILIALRELGSEDLDA
jgi:hypothetical protein